MAVIEADFSYAKKLERFFYPKPLKIAAGGRNSTKSIFFGDNVLFDGAEKNIKTLCAREYYKSIDDSVHSLLRGRIKRYGMDDLFDVTDNKIKLNGEEIVKYIGLGLRPESVKSYEGFRRLWIEEAETISKRTWTVVPATFRDVGAEIWLSGNPRSRGDVFYKEFIGPYEKALFKDGFYEDDDILVVWINDTDNPFRMVDKWGTKLGLDEHGNQIMAEGFKQKERDLRKVAAGRMSQAMWNHIWLGDTYDQVDGSIVRAEWFDACIDAHKVLGFEPQGAKYVAFDPANEDGDPKGYAYRHGPVYMAICDTMEGDVNTSLTWATNKALAVGANHFTLDAGGLGLGLKGQLIKELQGTGCQYHLFNGAEAADNPDSIYQSIDNEDRNEHRTNRETFVNRRASRYFALADRFYKTFRAVEQHKKGAVPLGLDIDDLISLSSDITNMDEIRAEVCRLPEKLNNNGRKQIVSKIDMKKKPYELPSPNMADCLMMNTFTPRRKPEIRAPRSARWQ